MTTTMTAPTNKFEAKVRGNAIELTLYDKIGGDGITPKMIGEAIKGGGNRDLTMDIHSGGGSAFDGIAIYNILKSYPGKKTARIQGLAASAASVIAMAADHIQMNDSAMMMIHGIGGMAVGNAASHRKNLDTMEKLNAKIAGIYSVRTGGDAVSIRELMDEETWMTAEEAVVDGYADEIVYGDSPTNSFDLSDYQNVPQEAVERFGLRLETQPEAKEQVMTPDQFKAQHKDIVDGWLNDEHAAGYNTAKTDLTAMLEACGGDKAQAVQNFLDGKTVQQAKDAHAASLADELTAMKAKLAAAEAKAAELTNGADPLKTDGNQQIKPEDDEAAKKNAKVHKAAAAIPAGYARNAYINSLGLDPADFTFQD